LIASADGMNEKGLVANMLWLVESEYPPFEKDGNNKGLSISAWAQYILEYIGGKLVIHHDPSYTVMTNSPIYSEQLAVYDYWKNISGEVFLPGTNRASDRFARASYYLSAVPQTDNTRVAVATVMSIVRSVSGDKIRKAS